MNGSTAEREAWRRARVRGGVAASTMPHRGPFPARLAAKLNDSPANLAVDSSRNGMARHGIYATAVKGLRTPDKEV